MIEVVISTGWRVVTNTLGDMEFRRLTSEFSWELALRIAAWVTIELGLRLRTPCALNHATTMMQNSSETNPANMVHKLKDFTYSLDDRYSVFPVMRRVLFVLKF
jgi:hypothetical protein